jgi:hypothetical protein
MRDKMFAGLAGTILLAACATPAPPPPPPPPPPPVVVVTPEAIPYRPVPPGGAPYAMVVPGKDANGLRQTVNINLDPVETLWNFRSGWNVAALNCDDAEDARVIEGYSRFLTTFARPLTAANAELDRRTRRLHSSSRDAIRAREQRMTSVYNYFAQPPARDSFCSVARFVSAQMLDTPPTDATAFAAAYLPQFEAAFEQFFSEYEQYQLASAAWDRQYGAQYGASQPGYVAVWGTQGAAAVVETSFAAETFQPVGEVIDQATGVAVPIIPATEGAVTTPIVQPLPSTTTAGNRR